jgi:hypothetical protein
MTSRYEVLNDEPTLAFVIELFTAAGYSPLRQGHAVTVYGTGAGLHDNSVDLDVAVIDLEGIRIVQLNCLLRSVPGTFEAACLAAARGNGVSTVAKFDVHELTDVSAAESARFRVRASLPLFADHLSQEEFTKMTWLFLKETDAIDNELADILAG